MILHYKKIIGNKVYLSPRSVEDAEKYTEWLNINNINRTAELGVFIGDNDHLSCGYGSEAIMLILDYGFNFLNLNNIMLRVFDFNIRAIKAYKKGFCNERFF